VRKTNLNDAEGSFDFFSRKRGGIPESRNLLGQGGRGVLVYPLMGGRGEKHLPSWQVVSEAGKLFNPTSTA